VNLNEELELVLANLGKAQEDIYRAVSENLMLFYKQVGGACCGWFVHLRVNAQVVIAQGVI
jgi:hypothetical protein